jgi:hypothetical protein
LALATNRAGACLRETNGLLAASTTRVESIDTIAARLGLERGLPKIPGEDYLIRVVNGRVDLLKFVSIEFSPLKITALDLKTLSHQTLGEADDFRLIHAFRGEAAGDLRSQSTFLTLDGSVSRPIFLMNHQGDLLAAHQRAGGLWSFSQDLFLPTPPFEFAVASESPSGPVVQDVIGRSADGLRFMILTKSATGPSRAIVEASPQQLWRRFEWHMFRYAPTLRVGQTVFNGQGQRVFVSRIYANEAGDAMILIHNGANEARWLRDSEIFFDEWSKAGTLIDLEVIGRSHDRSYLVRDTGGQIRVLSQADAIEHHGAAQSLEDVADDVLGRVEQGRAMPRVGQNPPAGSQRRLVFPKSPKSTEQKSIGPGARVFVVYPTEPLQTSTEGVFLSFVEASGGVTKMNIALTDQAKTQHSLLGSKIIVRPFQPGDYLFKNPIVYDPRGIAHYEARGQFLDGRVLVKNLSSGAVEILPASHFDQPQLLFFELVERLKMSSQVLSTSTRVRVLARGGGEHEVARGAVEQIAKRGEQILLTLKQGNDPLKAFLTFDSTDELAARLEALWD